MTITTERLKQIIDAAQKSIDNLKEGDVFPSAYGAAEADGFTDQIEKSLYTTVWLGGWEERRGQAAGPFEGPCLVTRLDPARREVCLWFAACGKPAAGKVLHPVIGEVATCKRCADRFELPFVDANK